MTGPMSPEAADWVYREALTRAYRSSVGADLGDGPAMVRACPCQWAACGHCLGGWHEQCTTRIGFAGRRPADPAAHLLARAGHVVAEVWPAGTPCAWRCPCDCPTPVPPAQPAPAPYRLALEQLDLLNLEGVL
uniref:DUF6248 family natural product biosynthesis protein n=1 Tax=Actinoplanes sp. CA-151224 TaxID=3239904 RepID=UPI003F4946A0